MSNPFFKFKQFVIKHDRCAMKVGTDGVLLGAWADLTGCKNILDIGTGTGLIALMTAQRSNAHIDAIEIDKKACQQAIENVRESVFCDRIEVFHTPFDRFIPVENKKYDLIVSNPPYFRDSLKGPNNQRNKARHDDGLSLNILLSKSSSFLTSNGRIALILPIDKQEELYSLTGKYGLYPVRQTVVYPTPDSSPKRILAEFSPIPLQTFKTDQLFIEISRHQYTPEYIELTKEFYLKM
ncbi:MAG: methyltransferase [Tannerellaceae bacterium]|nr:methyltransferase [Tannerellaceae bacterium]